MRFAITAKLAYHFDREAEVLLLLEAARTGDQEVIRDSITVTPHTDVARLYDPATNERRSVFTADGDVEIVYEALVQVTPPAGDYRQQPCVAIRNLPADVLHFLRPSRYCPSDRLESFVEREFTGLEGGAKAAAIADWITANLRYEIGTSNAYTTALDTFLEGAGVCRDFTHLAITFLRAAGIPARAVSAYAWKLEPPDMHAVTELYLGGRWWLMDATCKAPIEGLVRVATGVDAADIAFLSVFGNAYLQAQSFTIEAVNPP